MRAGQILTLWAMAVAAGVVTNAFVIAVAASFDVAAKGGCAAQLQGAHHFQLMDGESMLCAVVAAVAAEDVGHFPDGLGHVAQSCLSGVTTLRGRPRFFLGWASVSMGRRSSGLPVRLMVWGETEV